MKIYLAAPFFNPQQVAVVARIEDIIGLLGIEYYSPRSEGKILVQMEPWERKKYTKEIFDRNLEKMQWSDTILAVVDGRDQGVMIEVGFCIGMQMFDRGNYKILTYTEEGYGLNVMLQEAVDAHVKGTIQLTRLLENLAKNNDKVMEEYRNFNPAVT